jgi:hypothetical protein
LKTSAPILLAVTLFAATPGLALATKKVGSGKAVSPDKTLTYASAPFDTTVDSLPPKYMGHSCRTLAKKLASLGLKKNEFETTAAYRERLASASATVLTGSTTLADVVGFVSTDDGDSKIGGTYDADRGIMSIMESVGSGEQMVGSALLTTVKLDQKLKSHRSYEAANAYGRSVRVNSGTWDTCGLALSNFPHSTATIIARAIRQSIAMTPDEAREAKGNLRLLFVGNADAPYWTEYRERSKATIDDPVELQWEGEAVVLRLSQVWIFNKNSGKVYKKIEF